MVNPPPQLQDDGDCFSCERKGEKLICTAGSQCVAMSHPPPTPHEELRAAAEAVVDRWDTPLWKDVPATANYINRLRCVLAATSTAAAPDLMAAWQPIETSPRDGTRFLATDGYRVRLVRWASKYDRLPIGDVLGDSWTDLPWLWMPLPDPARHAAAQLVSASTAAPVARQGENNGGDYDTRHRQSSVHPAVNDRTVATRSPLSEPCASEPSARPVRPTVPDGWRLIAVNEDFSALMDALDRADRKGYMPDAMADEWAHFDWREGIATPVVQQAGDKP